MPSVNEFLVLLIAVVVLWVFLKLAKLAIRVVLFVIALALVAGAVWFFFPR